MLVRVWFRGGFPSLVTHSVAALGDQADNVLVVPEKQSAFRNLEVR